MKRLINRFLIPAASLHIIGALSAVSPTPAPFRRLLLFTSKQGFSPATPCSRPIRNFRFLNGDTAIVGADAKYGNRGALYTSFSKRPYGASRTKITAGDAAADDHFGGFGGCQRRHRYRGGLRQIR